MTFRLLLFFSLLPVLLPAQIWNGTDTLYGNEWIDFSKTYFKIRVADDGIYRISYQTLADAGFPVGSVPANQFRLYRYGIQEPVYTSTDGLLSGADFIEFFGERNRDATDRHLFEHPGEENLNPWYSLFNDTTAYYLCWDASGQAFRYAPVTNNLNNLPPKEPYCWFTDGQAYFNAFFKRQISTEITYSWFNGEGFSSTPNLNTDLYISPKRLYTASPPARLSIRFACDIGAHHQRLTWNDSLMTEDVFSGWNIREHQLEVPMSWVKADNLIRLQSLNNGSDRHAIAGAFLRYARLFDFENAPTSSFSLDAGPGPKYLEIQAFNTSGGAPVLYDLNNRFRLETAVVDGLVKALLPASATERRIWLANPDNGIRNVSALQPVQFRDYRPDNAGYIILSNATLFKDPAQNDANYVEEYADYRRSPLGGGFTVSIVDVNELYEQFSYGVRYHPLAVRNFLQYIEKHWTKPRFLLLIGKGLDYSTFRNPAVQQQLVDSLFFVPTYGAPGADQLFAMREKKLSDPLLATGRLAVVRPSEIRDYLSKVKEQEQAYLSADQTLAGKAWMKRVIHNSGGLAGETESIRQHTQAMADELEKNRVGADIYTYYKTSNDPVQLSSYEQMLGLLNGGVSIWMIFGHSSPNAVDFDIGAPDVYDNKGRYPLMMIMGCFSGLCSTPQKGIGEQFVLAPDRGAIAYFASVNFSFADALKTFGLKYYERLGGADYGLSIGETFSHTVSELKNTGYSALVALLHQNLLQGDPAIKLPFYPGPDYIIDPPSVKFDPNPASLDQPSLHLGFDVVNIGENTGGMLPLTVDQRRPDGQVLSRVTDTIAVAGFRQKLSYTIPTAGSQTGFNRFLLALNPQNTVAEQPSGATFNNELIDASGQPGTDLYFFADDVSPVMPPAYGIVRDTAVALRASTLNLQAAPLRYLFELDTLETFGSPFKKTGQVFQRGGLLEWKPSVLLQDSTVYYWRVARDSLVNGVVAWRTRSFLCLAGSPPPGGWNQSDYGQYVAEGFLANLQGVDSVRRLEFANNAANIDMTVAYRHRGLYPGIQNSYYDAFKGDYGMNVRGVGNDGVIVVVSDPNTGHFIQNTIPIGNPLQVVSGQRSLFYFNTQDSLRRVELMDFLQNYIPGGYYVGLLALGRADDPISYAPQFWAADSLSAGRNLFQVLETFGAKKVRQLPVFTNAPRPYGLLFQKGNLSFPVQDTILNSPDSVAMLRADFPAKWTSGYFETPAIGPVKSWKSLHWQKESSDDLSDAVSLSVFAVREGQPDSLVLQLRNSYDTLLDFIPATTFPQLKLRYEAQDQVKNTITRPAYLRVLFEPVPEGALHPAAYQAFYRDTLQQGEPGRLAIAFANISEAGFDSLLVKFRVEQENNAGQDYIRQFRPLPPGDTLHAFFDINTLNITGKQRLHIDVNPANAQPEFTHFNNTAVREFYVARDGRNPLLDVTFDGAHILDGDLVSSKPLVIITLKDENRFLAMTDTATFELKLVRPDGQMQAIPFNDPQILFLPADAGNLPKKNLARLEWSPVFTQDGDYRLLVNGRDASGNASGTLDYAVNFRVITKSSLSNLLNYPNPFSTSTCFVYTMTGAEPPAHFKIQIMTVSGRVVREITESEFGPLQAGTHRSNFCWDGRDEFGDPLANGVYLYRIMAKKADGSDFEFFENDAVDGYFKNGFGKMVLLR